jgi:hypothetical protein
MLRCVANDEVERVRRNVLVAKIEVLTRYCPGRTDDVWSVFARTVCKPIQI